MNLPRVLALGGAITRRDLATAFVIALLVIATRGFRLDWPRDMYFDEVYYAKAAVEYLAARAPTEWSHPPLSQELMALGIMALGDDRVVGTEAAPTGTLRFAVANDGTRAFATASELIVRARDGRQLARVRLDSAPAAIGFDGDTILVLGDRLARYATDGRVIAAVARPAVGTVRALAVGGGHIVVGGDDATALYQTPGAEPRILSHPTIAVTALPDGTQFFSLESGGVVRAIDPATGDASKTVQLDGPGRAIAYARAEGRLFVARADAPMLDVIDLVTQTTFTVPLANARTGTVASGASALATVPRTQFLYALADGHVIVVESRGATPYAAIPVDPGTRFLGVDGEGDALLAAGPDSLQRIDTGQHAFAWRVPGVVAGALLAAFAFLLARRLFAARRVAYLLAALLILDDSLFAQARVGIIDIYVTAFIVAAWYFIAAAHGAGRWSWANLLLSGLFTGLAIASKWTGLFAVAGIGVAVVGVTVYGMRTHVRTDSPLDLLGRRGRNAALLVGSFAVLPALVYFAAYQSWFGGPMTPNGWSLPQLIAAQFQSGTTLVSAHCEASPWWSWPVDLRGIYYSFVPVTPTSTAFVYDVGDPIFYWLAAPAAGLVAGIAMRARSASLGLVMVAFLAQLLGWSVTGRAPFFYYFVSALPFYLLALAVVLALVWERSRNTVLVCLVLGGIAALALYPIVSALPIANSTASLLALLPTWQHDPAFYPRESCTHSMLSSGATTATVALGVAYEAAAVGIAIAVARDLPVARGILRSLRLAPSPATQAHAARPRRPRRR